MQGSNGMELFMDSDRRKIRVQFGFFCAHFFTFIVVETWDFHFRMKSSNSND
jgi:hypothetical protein